MCNKARLDLPLCSLGKQATGLSPKIMTATAEPMSLFSVKATGICNSVKQASWQSNSGKTVMSPCQRRACREHDIG
jgi:hypothetical protein